MIDKILCRTSEKNSADCVIALLPNDFVNYFNEKVDNVRQQTSGSHPHFVKRCFDDLSKIFSFAPCFSSEIKAIILSFPVTFCVLDCLPAFIFKDYIDLFLPFVTDLINLCLVYGCFLWFMAVFNRPSNMPLLHFS